MSQVRLVDFAGQLERGKIYFFYSSIGKNGVRIHDDTDMLIATLPYNYEEWAAFLQKHNCDVNGDYVSHDMHSGESFLRESHKEAENGIEFEISAGKVSKEEEIEKDDWIRLL